MSLDRRSLLKILALSPLYLSTMRINALYRILNKLPSNTDTNLVFHGFFFFDFQPGVLVVASPAYSDHNFLFRDKDEYSLHEMPQEAVDLRDKLKAGPATPVWPGEILYFNKKEAKLDVPLVPSSYDSKKHGSLLILPYPENIAAIRYGGTTDEFMLSGNIAKYLKLPSDKNLGLITCLQYNKKVNLDFSTRHYYAEHCKTPGNRGMVDMFNAARDAFGGDFKKGFDLNMTQTKLSRREKAEYRKRLNAIPDDDYNDEAALRELRYVQGNPCNPFPAALQAKSRDKKLHSKSPENHLHKELIRTANCPQFGMVSS